MPPSAVAHLRARAGRRLLDFDGNVGIVRGRGSALCRSLDVVARERGRPGIPEAAVFNRKAAAYWIARSRLRQGYAGPRTRSAAEASAKAASRALTAELAMGDVAKGLAEAPQPVSLCPQNPLWCRPIRSARLWDRSTKSKA